MNKPKVFGIGLSKTGTTSLCRALKMLGYMSVHYPAAAKMLVRDWSALDDVDAASDISVAVVFRELDEAFPDSKFILTVREPESWLGSMQRNFDPVPKKYEETPELEVFARAYGGSSEFDRDRLSRAFHDHEVRVLSHFDGRENDLLVMDICAGEGWGRLCKFLDCPIPGRAFPCENISAMMDAV